MIHYYALWIPSYKEDIPKIQRDKLNEKEIQDIPGGDVIRLKADIDESFNIRLQYRINKSGWKQLLFYFMDRKEDGFVFYSLSLESQEAERDIMCRRLSKNLPKSIYHYFKEFFHTHSLHAAGEDSLLPVFHSKKKIDWNNKHTRSLAVTPIIKAYTDKFNGFYHQGKDNLQQCMAAITQNKEVTKNIHTLRTFLHDGYKVKREMAYCDFLLRKYGNEPDIIDNGIKEKITQAYQDFLTYYTDLDFWYHAYLDTIGFNDSKASKRWGISGGILGILSIAITLFLEFRPAQSDTPKSLLLNSDSLIIVRQDELNEKINQLIELCKPDTIQQKISTEKQTNSQLNIKKK